MSLYTNRYIKITLVAFLLLSIALGGALIFDSQEVLAASCPGTYQGSGGCWSGCSNLGGGNWNCVRNTYDAYVDGTGYLYYDHTGTPFTSNVNSPGGNPNNCPAFSC